PLALAILIGGCSPPPAPSTDTEAPNGHDHEHGDHDHGSHDEGAHDEEVGGTAAPSAESDLAESAAAKPEPTQESGAKVVTGDWTMWGGSPDRNMVNDTTPVNVDEFDPRTGE